MWIIRCTYFYILYQDELIIENLYIYIYTYKKSRIFKETLLFDLFKKMDSYLYTFTPNYPFQQMQVKEIEMIWMDDHRPL